MFDFFGSELPLAARFFIAFLVVLALIGLTAWLVRRFGASRLGGGARGRQPRLAVIDAASVDGRRRLVLIRRDNIEHLLMIGGPTDVVVEQNIVRAAAVREVPREPARPAAPAAPEAPARAAPPAETAWPLQSSTEPPPVAPPRPYRAPATDEPWLPHEPGARARPADSLTGLASELSTRLTPPEPEPPPPPPSAVVRREPPRAAQAPAEPPPAPQSDRNLAEMAQQLEAALRRSPAQEGRPPATDPLAQPPARPKALSRDFRARAEPKFEPRPEPASETGAEPKFEPKFDSRPEPRFESKPDSKPEPEPEPKFEYQPESEHAPAHSEPKTAELEDKTLYDNLEEEMASLLGRPPGKT